MKGNEFPKENNFDQNLPSDIEEALIQAVKGESNLTAFHTLFRVYAPKIYHYLAFQLVSSAKAEFLTGRVFIKAWQEIYDFDFQRTSFINWLYTLSSQSLIEYQWHKGFSLSSHEFEPAVQPETENQSARENPEDFLPPLFINNNCLLHRSILALPKDQRHVIYLKYIEEMTLAEISQLLGLEESQIGTILRGALHYLDRA